MNKSLESMSNANQTQTAGPFNATLKGKINNLEETIAQIKEEIIFYQKELTTLRSEKETLDDTLTRKAMDIRKTLTD